MKLDFIEMTPIWFNKRKRIYPAETARASEQQLSGAIMCYLLAFDRLCFRLHL